MMRKPLLKFAALLAGFVSLVASQPVHAKWPDRPVHIIVPFAAGGNTDLVARMASEYLAQLLGQAFIVENKVGAGGILAARALVASPPDGYTLMIAAAPQIVIAPFLQAVGFDPQRDFTPIKNISTNPFVLLVHRSVAADNLAGFLALARAGKIKLAYASAGPGSVSQIAAAMMFHAIGVEATHIPYKGNALALNDVMAGHVPMMFANLSEALAQTGNSKLRVLAVTGSARAPQLPDTPTLAEGGLTGFEAVTWNGLVGPAGVPDAIVRRIEGALTRQLSDPVVRERLQQLGVQPDAGSAADFATRIRTDLKVWGPAIAAAGLPSKISSKERP